MNMMSLSLPTPIIRDLNQELRDREKKVREGSELMIKHLDDSMPVWTHGRWISTAVRIDGKIEQRFRLVYSKEEALAWYKASNYLDCRIRAYHHECTDEAAPATILADIDKE